MQRDAVSQKQDFMDAPKCAGDEPHTLADRAGGLRAGECQTAHDNRNPNGHV
jgi:hypothetical protein